MSSITPTQPYGSHTSSQRPALSPRSLWATPRKTLTGEILVSKRGRYKLGEFIGRGATSFIYKATRIDAPLNHPLVVKVANEKCAPLRFTGECQALEELCHPNIINLIDYNLPQTANARLSVDGFMVMPWYSASLERFAPNSPGQIIDIVVQITQALQYAWARRLVHRDLKPSNIMLDDSGKPILIDFGIVKGCGGNIDEYVNLQTTGFDEFIGSMPYLDPLFVNSHTFLPPDKRYLRDIYALGIITYVLLFNHYFYFTVQNPLEAYQRSFNLVKSFPKYCAQTQQNFSLRSIFAVLRNMTALDMPRDSGAVCIFDPILSSSFGISASTSRRYASYAALLKDLNTLGERLKDYSLEQLRAELAQAIPA